jgi:tetratricopeptide (TPR) repeat protein
MISTTLSSALIALTVCLPSARAQSQEAAGDSVALKDGKSLQGLVKDEDIAGVTIEVGGKATTLPWDEVQSVGFGDAPDLGSALSSLVGGRFDEAAGVLEPLAGEKLRAPVRQEVMFHLGLVRQRRDETDGAIETYRKLLTDHPRGRYLRLAAENLVACLAAKKADAEIGPELDKLAGAAGDAAAEIELVRAHFDESLKRADDARKIYETLQGDSRPGIAAEARLGLVRIGKPADAETVLRQITTSAAPATVLAGAWNGLGDLMSDDGFKRRDSDKLLDAVYAYLRGVVQYKPRLGESTLEYERALAGAARCCKYISELETNADRKKLFAARAQERSSQLRAEFPQSIYLDK